MVKNITQDIKHDVKVLEPEMCIQLYNVLFRNIFKILKYVEAPDCYGKAVQMLDRSVVTVTEPNTLVILIRNTDNTCIQLG